MTTNPTKVEVMRNAPARTLFEYPVPSAMLRNRVHDAWPDGVVTVRLYPWLIAPSGVPIVGRGDPLLSPSACLHWQGIDSARPAIAPSARAAGH